MRSSTISRGILLWLLFVVSQVLALHVPRSVYPRYEYGVDRSTIVKRGDSLNSSRIVVEGVHGGIGPNGSLPLRLEIRDLEKDTISWTLYMLGLDMLQFTPEINSLSWYQIGGIHGRPHSPYDDVQATPGNENNGYCQHVSVLFPTWHRPYLALYEQVLYGIVQNIAQYFPPGPDKDKYVKAAANFRIPYWDWAMVPENSGSVLPESVQKPSVLVNGPGGAQMIRNPLYSYEFMPLNTTVFVDPPMNAYTETKRCPLNTDASARSRNEVVAQVLDNTADSIRSRLHGLFTNYNDYTSFSNEAWIPQGNPDHFDSIESVHDQIHGITGMGGHMTYSDYSAFDPLFFLHHAMVDRCLALWQIINPDNYVVPRAAIFSSFTTSRGEMQDSSTPLTPFRSDTAGNFWTSNSARQASTFGYAYPETTHPNSGNLTARVISSINRLYGGSSPTAKGVKVRDTLPKYFEWVANIKVRKNALGHPFFIHLFLGDFNPDPSSWNMEPNLVGTHAMFTKASALTAANCSCDLNQFVTATLPLTDALRSKVKAGELNTLDPVGAVDYIAKNLKYRLTNVEDTAIGNGQVPSLKISVLSAEVEKAESDVVFPRWGEMRGHLDVGTC